jgi:aminopeptidase
VPEPADDARLRAYARLAVRTGVDLQPGQELLVEAQIETAPFAQAIAAEAYAAGARHVDVHYADRRVRRAAVADAPEDALDWTPPWMLERLGRASELGSPLIAVTGWSGSDIFAGLDPARLARARPRELDRAWIAAVMERRIPWTAVAAPSEEWAREALGEPDLPRLWDAVAHALRLDEPDPAEAWARRLDELEARAAALSERGFTALRYRGPGTDLEVGLIEGSRWMAGRGRTVGESVHAPNLPTEEVFTSPHRLRAEGTVRSTLPLALRGTVVEGLELTLRGGEIVEVRARRGAEVVRGDLATDDGARRLGEVALVDDTSRVGATGVTFRNTLLDENAASHIAWGHGLSWTLGEAPPERHAELGLNGSATHVDFMVGSREVEIDGVEPGGTAVPILRDGRWQL